MSCKPCSNQKSNLIPGEKGDPGAPGAYLFYSNGINITYSDLSNPEILRSFVKPLTPFRENGQILKIRVVFTFTDQIDIGLRIAYESNIIFNTNNYSGLSNKSICVDIDIIKISDISIRVITNDVRQLNSILQSQIILPIQDFAGAFDEGNINFEVIAQGENPNVTCNFVSLIFYDIS